MRYPGILVGLIALAIVVVALVLWFSRNREKPMSATWVANAGMLLQLPAFHQSRRRMRFAVYGGVGALGAAAVALSVLAGAPVDRHVENAQLARRDLVLCLDASGSMLPYDGQILRQMQEMVDSFSGERMALQIWSAQTVTKFALTDDYGLMQEELEEAARIIDEGYMGEQGEYVLVSQELSEYLTGVDDPTEESRSSLVGDGLASCVLGFDHRDDDRSRTIIFATDNEIMGEQIYELSEAVDFASRQDVNIIALYPADGGVVTVEGEQMRRLIEGAGGTFYLTTDPSAVSAIIADIESQQLSTADGESRVVETDLPRTPLLWAIWLSIIGLALVTWRRL